MKNKLNILDMIKLEYYIQIDPYLNKNNCTIENISIIKSHFKILGFNEEETNYLSYSAIIPYEEIKEYINIYDNGEYDEELFLSELMIKYLKTNTKDKNKIKQDKEIITSRIKNIRNIIKYQNKTRRLTK